MYISEFIKENKTRKFLQCKKEKAKIIYFICEDGGKIIYIGKAANIIGRMQSHGVFCDYSRFSDKMVFYFVVDDSS